MEREEIWTEKYRPKKLEDVAGQNAIIKNLQSYVKRRNLPHLIFSGPAGVGKTAAAVAMARELYGDTWAENFTELNASVTPETPILIREKGEIKRTNFGELAKRSFKEDERYVKLSELEILSVDKDYQVKFMPVSLISRHKVEKIAEIKYEGGEVKTSLNHSVIVMDKEGDLISKKTSELKEGDLLITFTSAIENEDKLLEIRRYKPQLYIDLKGVMVRNPKVGNILKDMNIEEDLAWLFGAYLAEGCLSFRGNTSGGLVFTFGYPQEIKAVERAQRILDEKFGLKSSLKIGYSGFNRNKGSSIQIRTFNTQLAKFIRDNFYDGYKYDATTKRTPSFIYNSPLPYRLEFLKGYMNDGMGEWGEYLRYSSRSKENLIDISWLGRISGLNTSCFEEEARVVWKLPSYSYIKSEFLPAGTVICLLDRISKKINLRWRYTLRHQLYHKKSKRVSKRIVKEILSEIKEEKAEEEIKKLSKLLNSPLSVVLVKKIETKEYDDFVYDLAVPGAEMFWGGTAPILLHNSDERGIEVVRNQIKNFARTMPIGNAAFKIIFLDEADALTDAAQSALRRTMERYSGTCRFILSCNYSSKIIEPIQSRCSVYRFKLLSYDAIASRIKYIADMEGLKLTEEAIEAINYVSMGDMRRAVNALQSAAVLSSEIKPEMIYEITATARPEEIKELIKRALDGKFFDALDKLEELMDKGISGDEILAQMHRLVINMDIPARKKVELMNRIGEADYRITEGANERIQLDALLASFCLASSDE